MLYVPLYERLAVLFYVSVFPVRAICRAQWMLLIRANANVANNRFETYTWTIDSDRSRFNAVPIPIECAAAVETKTQR